MERKHSATRDSIIRQFWFLVPWLWCKHPEVEHTAHALARLVEDETDVSAWQCLAAMTLEDPSLHLEVLYRLRRLDPDDDSNNARIRYYESKPTGLDGIRDADYRARVLS